MIFLLPPYSDGIQDNIKKEVSLALAKTFVSDRIITQDLQPVPKPVKVAVLHVFMKQRFMAFVLVMGLYWKVRGWLLVRLTVNTLP